MKSTVLTGTLCLALGFTIGWLSKPGRSEAVAVTSDTPSTSAPKASPSAKIVDSPTIPSKSTRPMDDQDDKRPPIAFSGPNPAMQERFEEMIIAQAKNKTANKVADLTEKLSLTTEQATKLQTYFDRQIAELTDSGDSMPDMLALARIQSTKSIDTALADILTEDQSAAYEELKTNERNRKVESRAYKDLARVNSVLDLNDDQKNAVYDILYEEAAAKEDKSNDTGSAMAMVMDGHGIDIDVDDIAIGGISAVVEDARDSKGNPSPMSHEDIMKNMRERKQKRIDDQVERLAPALTPEQTAQYRKHLESKNSGMFQNMMIDGDGATGVFSIETHVAE